MKIERDYESKKKVLLSSISPGESFTYELNSSYEVYQLIDLNGLLEPTNFLLETLITKLSNRIYCVEIRSGILYHCGKDDMVYPVNIVAKVSYNEN